MHPKLQARFDLNGAVAIITGGAGLLGVKHAEAILMGGGIPVLVDIAADSAAMWSRQLADAFSSRVLHFTGDITNPAQVQSLVEFVIAETGRVDILINNATNNPKVEDGGANLSRLENFPLDQWNTDLAVGLTGAFLCSQILGAEMARRGHGVILNIASDLGVIAPDQRIYRQEGLPDDAQPVKPVTYSVVKTGLIGLTRYLATYWVEQGVRCNCISPGGVYNGQPQDFVERLANLIPMKRMAGPDEYQAAILFLCSDASAYMNGTNLVMDGGRTVW